MMKRNAFVLSILYIFAAQSLWGQDLPGNEPEIERFCQQQQINSSGNNAVRSGCVLEQRTALKKRFLNCTMISNKLILDGASSVRFISDCQRQTDTKNIEDRFLSSQISKGSIPGAVCSVDTAQFHNWYFFDSANSLFEKSDSSLPTHWSGECIQGKAQGKGKLRIDGDFYIGGFSTERGQFEFEGNMIEGKFNGNVTLVSMPDTHPLKVKSRDKYFSRANFFSDGRNVGIQFNRNCLSASIPNFEKKNDESTEFYGFCDSSGIALNGIVVSKFRGSNVDLACLENGVLAEQSRTDQFKACAPFWNQLPEFCITSGFAGQCKNGVPNGLGIDTAQGNTKYVKRGNFQNGMLNGFGYSASVSGCGIAGCSGNRIVEQGWFVRGIKQLNCATYIECIGKISGRELAIERNRWRGENLGGLEFLRKQADFDSAIEAYNISGDKNDLKTAQSLAKTPSQKMTLEYTAMQALGFHKSLFVNAEMKNGSQLVSMADSNKLLGFYKNVSSQFPVTINWSAKNNKDLLPLKFGSYEVTLSVGVNVVKTKRSCFVGICQDSQDTDRYVKKVTFILSVKNGFKDEGQIALAVAGADTSSMFGVQSGTVIQSIDPILLIESIKPTEMR